MSDFDPYLKWLGIRKTAQSIDHYRLLGLELFEDDSEVIAMAADRQMTHIRTYQNGPNGEASQQILNELARARRCLLNAEKKAQYDAQLRQELQSPDTPESIPRSGLAPPPVIPSVTPEIVTPEIVSAEVFAAEVVAAEVVAAEVGIRVDADARSKTKKRERKQLAWSLFGWLSGAVVAVGVSAFLIGSGWLPNLNVAENEQVNPPELVFGDVEPSETLAPGDKTPRAITESSSPPTRTSQPDLVSAMPSGSAREAEPPKTEPPKTEPPSAGVSASRLGAVPPPKVKPSKNVFDFTNLSRYPRPDSSALRMFGNISREVSDGKTFRFEPISKHTEGQEFSDIPEVGELLIGLAYSVNKKQQINAIQPIYHDGLQARAGTSVPADSADLTCLIARPGYAVGQIKVSIARPINRLQVKFMRITTTGLDSQDYYNSDSYGDKAEPVRVVRNSQGTPVVGMYGRFEPLTGLTDLGLVGMGVSESDTVDNGDFPGRPDPVLAASELIKKLPEPNTRQRAAAKKELPSVVQDMISGPKSADASVNNARRLIDLGKTESDPNLKYVVFSAARQLAESNGALEVAVNAIQEIDIFFEIDFWKEIHRTVERASRKPSSASVFKKELDSLIDVATAQGEYAAASKLLADAIGFSKRSKDVESASTYERLRKRNQEFERIAEQSEKAAAVLQKQPENPAANLSQGIYFFVLKNDIEHAAQHWIKSNDRDLVKLAKSELELDQSDLQLVAVGDQWQELGKGNRTELEKKALQRALTLYENASSSLTGLKKQSVKYKIRELKQLLKK